MVEGRWPSKHKTPHHIIPRLPTSSQGDGVHIPSPKTMARWRSKRCGYCFGIGIGHATFHYWEVAHYLELAQANFSTSQQETTINMTLDFNMNIDVIMNCVVNATRHTRGYGFPVPFRSKLPTPKRNKNGTGTKQTKRTTRNHSTHSLRHGCMVLLLMVVHLFVYYSVEVGSLLLSSDS